MFDHVSIGVSDIPRSGRFYDAVTAALGVSRTNTTERSIYYGSAGAGITFAVTLPFDGNPATSGNGTMATIGAPDRETVDRLHGAALANGGSDEGGPGVRENGYYVAYWRDPDGNKMNAVAMG